MAKVIVISGHPHLERSIMNKTILEELKKAAEGGASIAIDDIAEKGCCHLDVAAEQALLKEADTIVFQFPVYWFNAPAMLKHWYSLRALHMVKGRAGLRARSSSSLRRPALRTAHTALPAWVIRSMNSSITSMSWLR